MMVHLKNPINLAHLSNCEVHRIPPEKLEQTVKDYDLLAAISMIFPMVWLILKQ